MGRISRVKSMGAGSAAPPSDHVNNRNNSERVRISEFTYVRWAYQAIS
jgi:hypothetical protein